MIKYYPLWLKGMETTIHYDAAWLSGIGRLLPFPAPQHLKEGN